MGQARERSRCAVSVCWPISSSLPWIGFILSTLLFILAFILALEEKRKLVLIISPPLITAVVILIFAKFIMMPLPKGVGIFAEFSRLFY